MAAKADKARSAAAGEDPAAAPDAVEADEGEVVDAEVVEVDEVAGTSGMPVDSEPERSPDEAIAAEGEPGDANSELTQTQRQRDEYLDLAQRTKADFDNYRKRMAAEVTAAGARARTELGTGLVSVIDNLEHALTAAGIDPAAALAGETKADGELEQGIALTYRELASVLARAGIQPYDPTGEAFDPTWHEALQTRPAEDADPGTVVEVLQKGYRLDEQVVRAARVVVSE